MIFRRWNTILDGHFWSQVRYVLQFTKPIYNMVWFVDIDKPVIREVYEQMDSMLGHIKDIVQPKDAILYDHIHKHVVKRWDNLNVFIACLSICVNSKILFSILVGQTNTWRWG